MTYKSTLRQMNSFSRAMGKAAKEKKKKEKDHLYNINSDIEKFKVYTGTAPVGYWLAAIFLISIISIFIGLFISITIDSGFWTGYLASFLVLIVFCYWWGASTIEVNKNQKEVFDSAILSLKELLNKHLKTLLIKQSQLIITDSYGNKIIDDWEKEKTYFVENVVRKDKRFDKLSAALINLIIEDTIVENKPKHESTSTELDDNATPLDYERYCADILSKKGWQTRLTKATGDQGVDIVAEKGSVKVVLQCKKYGFPVGNKAVQEALAGKEFESADYAAVVTNAQFTKSAQQLAAKTGVLLLHHAELENLENSLI